MKKQRRRFKDRHDGRYLRKVDPFYKIIPYIMKTRVDAQVYFDDKVYLGETEKYIRDIRKNEGLHVGFLHIVIAAMVRVMSQKPRINRFVSGRKLFARNEISVSLAVKKDMNEDTPETTVKVIFEPTDTIYEVIDKMNKAINENKKVNSDNETDKMAKLIMLCPGFLVRFVVWLVNFLDNKGKMPKVMHKVSPFHTSLFITDLGSLGIQPVYHHIYEFGTTSLFAAFGIKNKERTLDSKGNIKVSKFINMKVVADERIVDGFYYASAFKLFRHYMQHPEELSTKPERVYEDSEI